MTCGPEQERSRNVLQNFDNPAFRYIFLPTADLFPYLAVFNRSWIDLFSNIEIPDRWANSLINILKK